MKDPTETSAHPPTVDGEAWFLAGGGVSGQLARTVDWSRTPVGRVEQWPGALRTTLAMMLHARQPMFLWWGSELVQFYNDAYLPSFGLGKHPAAMGQRGADCWQEIWPIIWPQIDDVMSRAKASWNEDKLVPIHRNGKIEEVFWTYSYTPVFGENGAVGGTLVICTETTARVLIERRTALLGALVAALALTESGWSLLRATTEALKNDPADVPCGAFFKRRTGLSDLVAVESFGLSAAAAAAFGKQIQKHGSRPGVIALPAEPFSLSPANACNEGIVIALGYSTQGADLLLLGLSPRLPFDESYRRFIAQIGEHFETASRRLEASRLRAVAEAERNSLLEQAPVATAILTGPEHLFVLANPRYRQMVGRPMLVGKTYLEAFPELAETSLPGILDRVYRTGEPFLTNELLVPLDRGGGAREDCYFKFNLEPIRKASGEVYGMMAVAVDITELVGARQVLEKSNAEREQLLRDLESASRAKDEFLAMLGHELRNPLSPIVTALQLMRTTASGSSSKAQEIIQRQVDHLVRLVDDLLDVSKITRGKLELRLQTVDLADVIGKSVEIASFLLERGNHPLELDVAHGALYCTGDPVRLAQVVANLLTNAARYSAAGGPITLRAVRDGDAVIISVKDKGIGIASEMLTRVFDLFVQAKRSSDRAEGGLGIGLALVKNLVLLHGGTVWAQSDGPGQGSEFFVRLPAVDTAPVVGSDLDASPSSRPEHVRRVLLVDDNADAVDLLRDLLALYGHEVAVATDPLSAIELAHRFSPDVAILDIGLPVMDGYELAARLKSDPRTARCLLIALSGYGQRHDRDRSAAAGFDHHLVKPVDIDRLAALLVE